MSYLFFIDESGNDRKQMPYEIHGGIAVPLRRAWSLIQTIKDAELRLFGEVLASFDLEVKGERLLQKRTFKFARGINKNNPAGTNRPSQAEDERRHAALSFLKKGKAGDESIRPSATEFQAYGLACLELVDEIFQACDRHEVKILAAVVEVDAPRPEQRDWEEMLRKDLVDLFERLYHLMESQPDESMAVCVFDQKDDLRGERCIEGRRLNEGMARYFSRSHTGRVRSSRILPEPVYARSDLTTLLGVADLVIYVINHVFRPDASWSRPIRPELTPYVDWIERLQWVGTRDGQNSLLGIFRMADLKPRGA